MENQKVEQWHNVVRCAHLEGGLRAINEPGASVTFKPNLPSKSPNLTLEQYSHLHRDLRDTGLQLIGVAYFQSEYELAGLYPPNWRPHHLPRGDVASDVSTLWANLAIAGHEIDDFGFVDICRRIAFQIDACAWRLHDLSDSYHKELCARISDSIFKSGQRFESINSFHISLAAHSYFSEVTTLRDYLAEFIANYVFSSVARHGRKVRLMKGLRKEVLSKIDPEHALKREIEQICADDGWLKIVSAYRDLAIHYAPLEFVDGHASFETSIFRSKAGDEFPGIRFHLPKDPVGLKNQRSGEPSIKSASEWIKATHYAWTDGSRGPDALLIAYHSLQWLSDFAQRVGSYAPVKPKRVHYTVGDNNKIREQRFVDP